MDRHIINDDDLHASLPAPLRFGAKLDQYNSASVKTEGSSSSGDSSPGVPPTPVVAPAGAAAQPFNLGACLVIGALSLGGCCERPTPPSGLQQYPCNPYCMPPVSNGKGIER